jgi:hypothetical protein
MEDNTLIVFNSITKFVHSLNDCFGEKQRSLQLYSRLIEKTTIIHEGPIKKHIAAFKKFCDTNKNAIYDKDESKFTENQIIYSERVFINMKDVFQTASKDEKEIIWKHFLLLMTRMDPSGKAKKILKESIRKGNESNNEENFLNNIINKVEQNVTPSDNPMQAVSSVMSSGLFTDLIGNMTSGLNNGELDLGKLMGTVNGMVNNIADKSDMPPEMAGMMSQMTGMMNQLNKMQENGVPNSKTMSKKEKKKMKKKMKKMKSQHDNMVSDLKNLSTTATEVDSNKEITFEVLPEKTNSENEKTLSVDNN